MVQKLIFFDLDHTLIDPCFEARKRIFQFWEDVIAPKIQAEIIETAELADFPIFLHREDVNLRHLYDIRNQNPALAASTLANIIGAKFLAYGKKNPQINRTNLHRLRDRIVRPICGTQFEKGNMILKTMGDLHETEEHYFDEALALLPALKEAGHLIGIITARPPADSANPLSIIEAENPIMDFITPALVFSQIDGKKGESIGRAQLAESIQIAALESNLTLPNSEDIILVGDQVNDVLLAQELQCQMIVAAYSHEKFFTKKQSLRFNQAEAEVIAQGRACETVYTLTALKTSLQKLGALFV